MVSDNFIDGKPILSRIVGSLLTALLTLGIAWLAFGWESEASFKEEVSKELGNKATRIELKALRGESFEYTDDQIKVHADAEEGEIDAKINAVVILVKSMDKKLDILLGKSIPNRN